KRRLRKQRLKDHLSARADFRRSNATRFFADENIEPWVVWLMRRNDLDVVTARELGTVGHDDQAVFSAAWRLKRVIVTHDFDFMNDTAFPFNRCPGVLILPDMGRNMMELGRIANTATLLLQRGDRIWNGTKIEVSRDRVLTVRTWEKDE